ncbi:MAG: polysaccharide biosynthesis/export family protein [Tistlia sp.]
MLRTIVALLLCGGLAAACAGTGGGGEPLLAALDIKESYKLSAGDRLRINVYGQSDVSGEFEVDSGGTISYPLLGPVEVKGRTIAQVADTITERLDADFIADPRVNVEVVNFRPFFILGEVNAPGQYPFASGLTVRQAIALAGGYTRRASTSGIEVIRQTEEGSVTYEVAEDSVLMPGDTIEVPRRFF